MSEVALVLGHSLLWIILAGGAILATVGYHKKQEEWGKVTIGLAALALAFGLWATGFFVDILQHQSKVLPLAWLCACLAIVFLTAAAVTLGIRIGKK